jgi:hypothetical protein
LAEHDLANLDAYTAAARLLLDGRPTRAFTLATRPPSPAGGHLVEVRAAVTDRASVAPPGTVRSTEGANPDVANSDVVRPHP